MTVMLRSANILHRSMRLGVTLVEMFVVLAIIAGMIGLLFPALHASRESAHKTGCLNNLHQIRLALQQYVDVNNEAPPKNGWAAAILDWIEESPALSELQEGSSDVPRPAVFVCPSHPGLDSVKPDLQPNTYAIVLVRTDGQRKPMGGLRIVDRATDLTADELVPWWVGPELSPMEFANAERRKTGPHRGGTFQHMGVNVPWR